MNIREIGIDGANWIQLAQHSPVASVCEHDNERSCSIKKAGYCLRNGVTIDFSKNILYHAVSWLRFLPTRETCNNEYVSTCVPVGVDFKCHHR
jgi:hypothetical protein